MPGDRLLRYCRSFAAATSKDLTKRFRNLFWDILPLFRGKIMHLTYGSSMSASVPRGKDGVLVCTNGQSMPGDAVDIVPELCTAPDSLMAG